MQEVIHFRFNHARFNDLLQSFEARRGAKISGGSRLESLDGDQRRDNMMKLEEVLD